MSKRSSFSIKGSLWEQQKIFLNPIPTGHGRNQPIYERHMTKSGRNRVNTYYETEIPSLTRISGHVESTNLVNTNFA